jgi:LacI family transcriptional regulator
MATEHLIAVGCRRLAHISGPHASTALGRRDGFWRTVINHGLPMSEPYMIVADHGDKAGDVNGYAAMQKLLQLNPRPDGVFCHNDPNAMGAMNAIFEAGLRIPEDIAVIGCGDVGYGKNLRVPLSSINQSSEAIGAHAAELAFDLLDSKGPVKPKTIILEPKLMARASSLRA